MGNANDDRATMAANLYLDTGTAFRYVMDGLAGRFSIEDGNMVWGTASSGTAGTVATVDTKMTLLNNGNLGIGCSPDYKLQVESTSDADLFSIKSTAIANNTQMRLGISGNDSVISGTGGSTGSLVFKTYGSERMRITSGARINMDVMAGQASEGVIRIGRYDANTSRYNEIQNSVTSSAAGSYMNLSVHSGTENVVTDVMTLLGSGNVGIGCSPDAKLMVKDSSDSGFDSGIAIIRSASSQTGYINMVGGAMNFNSPSIPIIFRQSGTERMRIDSSGNVGIAATPPTNGYTASGGGWKMLQIGQSSQIAAYGTDDEIGIFQNTYLNSSGVFQAITSNVAGSSIILVDGKIYFKTATTSGTAQTTSTRMFINTDGNVGIGTDSPTQAKLVSSYNGTVNNGMAIINTNTGTLVQNLMIFKRGTTEVGSITSNNTTTTYVTSSDYRLKENVVSMTGALDRVSQLKPSRFNFIADADKTVDGFLAHEVQQIVPEAIIGEKDAMQDEEYELSPAVYEDVLHPAIEEELDEDGNIITEAKEEWTENVLKTEAVKDTRQVPKYQGIDQSKLVPLLVGAIQELKAEIDDLKNKCNCK
jgi:hypothetical protein